MIPKEKVQVLLKGFLVCSCILSHYQSLPGPSFGNDPKALYAALADCQHLCITLSHVPTLPSFEAALGPHGMKTFQHYIKVLMNRIESGKGWPKSGELRTYGVFYIIDNINSYLEQVACSSLYGTVEEGRAQYNKLVKEAEKETLEHLGQNPEEKP